MQKYHCSRQTSLVHYVYCSYSHFSLKVGWLMRAIVHYLTSSHTGTSLLDHSCCLQLLHGTPMVKLNWEGRNIGFDWVGIFICFYCQGTDIDENQFLICYIFHYFIFVDHLFIMLLVLEIKHAYGKMFAINIHIEV